MTEPKTKKTSASVSAFIAAVENDQRRKDASAVDELLREISGEEPAMWGPAIIGYGAYDSATGEWPRIGFSPRKASLVIYIEPEFEARAPLLKKLGRHKTGKVCLYINKLDDVDAAVLRDLVKASWTHTETKNT